VLKRKKSHNWVRPSNAVAPKLPPREDKKKEKKDKSSPQGRTEWRNISSS
jgi:hypothetical protein